MRLLDVTQEIASEVATGIAGRAFRERRRE